MNIKSFLHVRLYLTAAASVLFLLQGCESDEEKNQTDYKSGVLIVNEGKFQAGTGTVNYYNPESGEVIENIFKNEEGFAGDVLQSITIDGDNAYLILNGDNKVEVADGKDFTSITTYSAPILDKPRYMEVINGKAYISVWGPYEGWNLVNSCVLVLNAATMAPLDTIYTDEGTENLLYNGEYLFASNFNYGSSSTVSVIDPSDNSLVDEIELAAGPAGSVVDKNNKVWVLTTGFGENDSKLFRVNPATFEVEDYIELGVNAGGDLSITPDRENMLYYAGKKVYKIAITATEAPSSALIEETNAVVPYSLGVDPVTGDIYFGDALDYASAGKVYIYNAAGTYQKTLTSGICPTQFIFRK